VRKNHRERGSIVVETALTVGLGLTIIHFTVDVGALGFLQLTADSAAFVNSHNYAVITTASSKPEVLTHAIFPQVQPSDIATSPQPAPTIVLPVDYQFNGTTAEQQMTTQRHSGVTMVEPILYSTTVKPHGMVSYLAKMLGVTGNAIEPQFKECGPHYNVAEVNVQCGTAAQPSGYEIDPIPSPAAGIASGGENTPPYYLSFNYRFKCADKQPWTGCSTPANASGGIYEAFGVAELLDANNWGAANPAASGSGKSNGQPTSVFQYMLCHQQIYSQLARVFAANTSINSLNTGGYYPGTNYASIVAAGPTNFASWNEFDTPNNAFVQEIYSWDDTVPYNQALNPATEPGGTSSLVLHPDASC